jgi:hypothetical protein
MSDDVLYKGAGRAYDSYTRVRLGGCWHLGGGKDGCVTSGIAGGGGFCSLTNRGGVHSLSRLYLQQLPCCPMSNNPCISPLFAGVRCVVDLLVRPGLVNLDFADVRAIMTDAGRALIGTSAATGAVRYRCTRQPYFPNVLAFRTTSDSYYSTPRCHGYCAAFFSFSSSIFTAFAHIHYNKYLLHFFALEPHYSARQCLLVRTGARRRCLAHCRTRCLRAGAYGALQACC